jgi:hypothetical protein
MLKGYAEDCKEASVNVCLLTIFLPNSLTLLSAFAVVSGLVLFVRGFRVLARKRLVLDTPTCKIRSAPLGLVEVSGLAGGPHTLSAPITNVACYLYHTIVWRKREAGKNEWEKVIDETISIPFFLDDNTGQVLVDPTGAELDLHRDFREEYNSSFFASFGDVPPSVREFVARHGISTTSALRVEERCIKPKNALFVVGTVMENPSRIWPRTQEQATVPPPKTLLARIELPIPHEVVHLSTISPSQSSGEMTLQGKIAAALNRAQITKPEAWAAAGLPGGPNATETAEANETSKDPSPPSVADLAPSTMLQKGQNDPTFMISWRSRQALIRRLGWKSFGMVWGGSALVLLGIYSILQQAELL